ncbi:Maf family protein [Caldilinea sp.]|uniref:Maf family protein n=1 Tax=Caldilinea sp. TaxID=2293560 RepID=UPI002C484591|nr:Maf family protein [Caldilinea sp.]
MTSQPQLILASASQRRQQFLRDLGLAYTVHVADIDETPLPNEDPAAMTRRLAEAKAEAVALRLQDAAQEQIIIASDTTVALENTIYGKPVDDEDAAHMLRALRNRTHSVISAVAVLRLPDRWLETRVNTTAVTMRDYTDAEIAAYVATGDPLDKAGAYGIQSSGFAPACALDGCYAGVMGLPLADLCDLLVARGVVIPHDPAQVCAAHNSFACCFASTQRAFFVDFDAR